MPTLGQRVHKLVTQGTKVFVDPSLFKTSQMRDETRLSDFETENVSLPIVESTVVCLSTMMAQYDVDDAFTIPIRGAQMRDEVKGGDFENTCYILMKNIDETMKDPMIVNSCKICSFTPFYRSGDIVNIEEVDPNEETMENIRGMVKRTQRFFVEFGNPIDASFDYPIREIEAKYIDFWDGEFLMDGSLARIKIEENDDLTVEDALLIVTEYVVGYASKDDRFRSKDMVLRVFNCRRNRVYSCRVSDIPKSVLNDVCKEVVGISPVF